MSGGHTPGPWAIDRGVHGVRIEAADERYGQSVGRAVIAIVSQHRAGAADRVAPDAIQDANARLIAAAPKLLGAMQGRDIDPDVTPIEWISSLVTDVRAALDSGEWEYEDAASLRECLWNIGTFVTAARAAVAEAVGP